MKIGILTLPLNNNYGGLLQCFALQKVLKSLGHDAWVVQRGYVNRSIIWRIFHYVRQTMKVLLGRKFVHLLPSKEIKYIRKNTSNFISNYIEPTTEHIRTNKQLANFHFSNKFDAYVVGSDQVWRPCYSPCITNYFFDFISPNEKVKRVAYAASFGVDEWEFTEKETIICGDLLRLFNAVSVRENTAIALCSNNWGREDVIQVLDPTMLLEKEDYIRIVEKENEPKSPGNLFCYILDESSEKNQVVESIASRIDAVSFTQMPKCEITYENLRDRLDDCVYPSVTAWLRAFMDADMVVTDSFHGCVFSIIFNKPFWVIGNEGRGLARFNSLLSLFELQSRMINSSSMPTDITDPIDWSQVNAIRRKWIETSLNFLKNNL